MTRPDVSKQCNPGTQHCNPSSVALSQDMWNSRRQSVPAPAQPLHRNRARSKAQLRRTSNDISTPHVGHDAPRLLLPSGAYAGARFSDSPSAHTLPPPPRHWVTDGSKGDGRIERGKVKGAWTAESDSAWHEDCFQQMTLVLKNILKVQA